MQIDCPHLDILVPDAVGEEQAAARTTHLAIGAHPDDVEILGIHGILECHDTADRWFTGIVTCDGAGSPRAGDYADYSDKQMAARRREEQREAAKLGRYSLLVQLGHPSSVDAGELADNLVTLLQACRPGVVYLHNLADAHATHRSIARASLAALRRLPADQQPKQVYGVEVWRSLDWLPAQQRVSLALEDGRGLQAELLRCHDSQVSGGKRYDRAFIARQQANATLAASHETDQAEACVLALDLSPLLEDPALDPDQWLDQLVAGFRDELRD